MRQTPLFLGALILGACGGTESPTETADPPVATTVTLSPTTLSFASFGAAQQLTATVRDQNGATMSGASVVWESVTPTVASVSPTGLVTAVADGASSITATAAGVVSGPVTVTVLQELAAVEVTPADETLIALGDAVVFAATGTDALGNAMDGSAWEWSSSNEAVATVDADGNATAQGVGSTSITATTAGVSGSGQLAVEPVPVARLAIPDSVGVGSQVSVGVQLLIAGYGNVAGAFAFTLSFAPSVLQYSEGTSGYYVALITDNIGGTLRMVVSEPTGIAENDTVVTVVFDVVGGAGGESDLSVSIDGLIAASTFTDFTADGVGQTRSLIIR